MYRGHVGNIETPSNEKHISAGGTDGRRSVAGQHGRHNGRAISGGGGGGRAPGGFICGGSAAVPGTSAPLDTTLVHDRAASGGVQGAAQARGGDFMQLRGTYISS